MAMIWKENDGLGLGNVSSAHDGSNRARWDQTSPITLLRPFIFEDYNKIGLSDLNIVFQG